jgi:hypothetical protein
MEITIPFQATPDSSINEFTGACISPSLPGSLTDGSDPAVGLHACINVLDGA